MQAVTKAEFPLLFAVIHNMESKARATGLCFHRSVAMLLDMPIAAELCIGTLKCATPEELAANPILSPTPFIHCWIEYGTKLFAPTTYEAAGGYIMVMDRDEYYAKNGVRDVHRLNRYTVKKLADKHRLRPHLRNSSPLEEGTHFASIFLEAADVFWTISDRGGIVPIEALIETLKELPCS